MNLEQKQKDFPINYNFDWTYGVEISKIREDLNELEKLGATHINIEADMYYESASIEINAVCNRLETIEEAQDRIQKENEYQERVKARDLKRLEELKAKYE